MARLRKIMVPGWLKGGLAVAAVLLLMNAKPARADILLTLDSVTPVGSDFQYTYDAMLSVGSILHAAGGGANNGFSPSNNFFTLYDVQGLVPNSESYTGAMGGNVTATEQMLGVTPPGVTAIPADAANLPNITTYWIGTDLAAPSGPVNLGTFSFLDTNPVGEGLLAYAGATQKLELFPFGIANNLSQIAGPGSFTPPVVPEPATLALLAIGLPMLGGYCYRRRKA
jgi:hypothetical protein